ncbi:hypothetical protein JMUB6875_55550 [Nocardia sp. JMUB6875]
MAVAGAIALIPLAAVTIPASADVPLDNAPTDVAWPHNHNHNNNPWWDRDDWRHDRDRDDWNRGFPGWWNNNDDCWRNGLPHTGSW